MWREQEPTRLRVRHALEAVAIGFAMGWLSTGFVRAAIPAWGCLLHGAACTVFSLQLVGVVLAIRLAGNKPIVPAAALTAIAAIGGELLQAWFGIAWSVTNFSLPLAATPVAQWAAWGTPLGVAGVVYWVNFLATPDFSATIFWRRWIGPPTAACIALTAWFGGGVIADTTVVEPMPFSVMLVQPHLRGQTHVAWRPWIELDRLTQANLDREGPVDLIVWPESCLTISRLEDAGSDAPKHFEQRLTVGDFNKTLRPRYNTNCLAGVVIQKRVMETRYGLLVPKAKLYNCGCLVSRSGEISCHEKQALVPFKEGLPPWMNQAWIGGRLLPFFQLSGTLTAGNRFHLLSFRDHRDHGRTIAVSICYESFLFWLPQYRNDNSVDAIVHLVYDGDWHNHPGVIERQILACRYRAIETRKWNLVCSTWTGTTIIDPRGRVVCQLPAEPGVLRSDSVGGSISFDRDVLRSEEASSATAIPGEARLDEKLNSQGTGR